MALQAYIHFEVAKGLTYTNFIPYIIHLAKWLYYTAINGALL